MGIGLTRGVLTLLVSSCVAVFAGRWLMSFWTGTAKIHELYTAACGLYVCWLSIRAITVLLAWMPQGRRVIVLKVQEWTLMVQSIRLVGKVVGTTPVFVYLVEICLLVIMFICSFLKLLGKPTPQSSSPTIRVQCVL